MYCYYYYLLNFLIVFSEVLTFGYYAFSLLVPINCRVGIFSRRNPIPRGGTKSNRLILITRNSNYLQNQKMLASNGEINEQLLAPNFLCPVCNQGFVSRNAMYRHLRSDYSNTDTMESSSCKQLAINQGLAIYPKDGINFDRLKRQTVVLKIAFSDYSTNLQNILEKLVQGINYILRQ